MSRGKTFHRYRLVRRIARGGMAEVFLALLRGPSGFEKRVVLKKILPVYAAMEEFGVLFRDEARLSALLEHSAIVQTFEFGRYEDEYFMAMEYVDGPDLKELLDRCRRRGILLPVEVVLHIVHELTRALEYSHLLTDDDGRAMSIIHRDVSPPNVLIGVHGAVKLTDFGVAKAAHRETDTRPGVLRGKYAYMSPEQVCEADIDHRSDIFSIGIVLYETLTGVNPFEGSTDFLTMEAVEKAVIEPAAFLRPDTPTELDRILLACLEPDPDLRYQSASDLRRDLSKVIRSLPAGDGPEQLVSFLRDVFPERVPDARQASAADLGSPIWEHLAHRLAAMTVPMPVAVRKELAPPSSEPPSKAESAPGNETPALVAAFDDAPESNSPSSAESPPYDEWVDEEEVSDRVHTQPGVLIKDSLTLDEVKERTEGDVPVFNEWDLGDDDAASPTDATNLGLDDERSLASPSKKPEPTQLPRHERPQFSGPSEQRAPGGPLNEPTPPPVKKSRSVRLRPPDRPRLRPNPTARTRVDKLAEPVKALEIPPPPWATEPTPEPQEPQSPAGAVDPTQPKPATSAESVAQEATRKVARPGWVNLTWVAAAVLVPLASLATVNWIDEVQRPSRTWKVVVPAADRTLEEPLPQRRVEPLPPTPPDPSSNESTSGTAPPGDDATPHAGKTGEK